MIMKNLLLNLKMIALICLLMVLGSVNVWSVNFIKTYSYGLSGWALTNHYDYPDFYLVPYENTTSVATIPGIFTRKKIISDVVITINCATYGKGSYTSPSTFSIFNGSDCKTAVTATQSGKLPLIADRYVDVIYTIKSSDVASLTKDLAIKITKSDRQIRLKSITVKFSFDGNKYNVAWNVNGNPYTQGSPTNKVVEGEKVSVLPTAPADIKGKVFVGWTNAPLSAAQDVVPSVLFKDAKRAPKVTGDVTYYAVFANRAGDGKVTYTKLASNKFKTDATYVIGAEGNIKGSIDYFYKYEVNTNCWGKMTSDLSVNSPLVFVLSGTADNLMAKDNNGNYLKCVNKNFQMSSNKASIKLNTDGTLLDVGKSYWLRYNCYGDWGLRWYEKDTETGNLAYFYEVSGGYTYSGYCTTVGATAAPTYTSKKLTFVAMDGEDYYATFSNEKVVFMPKNVTVQTVAVESGKITFTKNVDRVFGDAATVNIDGSEITGYYIPANTGVLLESNDNIVTYYSVENIGNTGYLDGSNMLKPSVAGGVFAAETGYKYYKLAYNDYYAKTDLGFYWGAENGGAFNVKAGTAYLAVPVTAAAAAKGFTLNSEATGIEGINANVENAKAIYNLNGQRVATMAKPGLYIVNGKKVVRK